VLAIASKITGTGTLKIDNAATLWITNTAEAVNYAAGAVATLKLGAPDSFTGAINGLALGDAIDFVGTTVTGATVVGSTLTVARSAGADLHYTVSGAFTGNHFAIVPDGFGGSDIILTAGTAAPAVLAPASIATTDAQPAAAAPSLADLIGSLGFDDIFAGGSALSHGNPGWSGGAYPFDPGKVSAAAGPQITSDNHDFMAVAHFN
jgi:hypothetical protein